MQKEGLSAATLKWIAAAAMTLDHIGLWCSLLGYSGIGLPLRIIGRIAAPVFLFLLTESLRHTSSRYRYLLRLWLGAVLHGAVGLLLSRLTGETMWLGNIFPTLFYTALTVTSIDALRKNRAFLPLLLLAAVIALGVLCDGSLLSLLFPRLTEVEYSLLFVLLGVGWYYGKERARQLLLFLFLCLLSVLIPSGHPLITALGFSPLFYSTQGWMLLALPLIALYNGERGRAPRAFFYWYYPLHQYVLLFFAILIKSA